MLNDATPLFWDIPSTTGWMERLVVSQHSVEGLYLPAFLFASATIIWTKMGDKLKDKSVKSVSGRAASVLLDIECIQTCTSGLVIISFFGVSQLFVAHVNILSLYSSTPIQISTLWRVNSWIQVSEHSLAVWNKVTEMVRNQGTTADWWSENVSRDMNYQVSHAPCTGVSFGVLMTWWWELSKTLLFRRLARWNVSCSAFVQHTHIRTYLNLE